MNNVTLLGRLTRDPEYRVTQSQTVVVNYTLAVDRRFKREGEPTADFIRCVAFGKTAEFAYKYFKKGTKIALEGRIQTGSYQDKDGKTVYTTDVVVENQEFAESKSASENDSETYAEPERPEAPDDFMTIQDIQENLPFM